MTRSRSCGSCPPDFISSSWPSTTRPWQARGVRSSTATFTGCCGCGGCARSPGPIRGMRPGSRTWRMRCGQTGGRDTDRGDRPGLGPQSCRRSAAAPGRVTYRAESEGSALVQLNGLPRAAFDALVERVAVLVREPRDAQLMAPGADPAYRQAVFGAGWGLLSFRVDEAAATRPGCFAILNLIRGDQLLVRWVIDPAPPASTILPLPRRWRAALAVALRPDLHNRCTVAPGFSRCLPGARSTGVTRPHMPAGQAGSWRAVPGTAVSAASG
jgi:hypothetical protein